MAVVLGEGLPGTCANVGDIDVAFAEGYDGMHVEFDEVCGPKMLII